MGYIMNLREKIGHSPLIGVGATTLVFNNKNELLLNLRSDTLTWGIPGGSKELNEETPFSGKYIDYKIKLK